jgi:hypothetical protein
MKKHPEVLNISTAVPPQLEYVYIYILTSSPEKNHIQLYHASLPPTGTALDSTKYWLRVLTANKLYVLPLTKYIKD